MTIWRLISLHSRGGGRAGTCNVLLAPCYNSLRGLSGAVKYMEQFMMTVGGVLIFCKGWTSSFNVFFGGGGGGEASVMLLLSLMLWAVINAGGKGCL
jgi:hypothetical protein